MNAKIATRCEQVSIKPFLQTLGLHFTDDIVIKMYLWQEIEQNFSLKNFFLTKMLIIIYIIIKSLTVKHRKR